VEGIWPTAMPFAASSTSFCVFLLVLGNVRCDFRNDQRKNQNAKTPPQYNVVIYSAPEKDYIIPFQEEKEMMYIKRRMKRELTIN
jgi:hypothetical protein